MRDPALDPRHSVRLIRRRLFGLLMQAFGAVVALTVLVLVALLALLAAAAFTGNTSLRLPQARMLEAYYLGHGSWDGVGAVLNQAQFSDGLEWDSLTLLDADGVVILEAGRSEGGQVGRPFDQPGHVRFPLHANGQVVGSLVLQRSGMELWQLFSGVAIPVLVISFFTGLLTLLIGLLLVRRFVNPLADVVAAARSVAAGDLGARVEVRGPGDLRSLSDSFNRMAAALQAADQQRRNLLADVAHELRTPLTVIRGSLEGMLDGVYPADEAHVAPVLEETYVLERLVDDLRTLTLAEARQLHFERERVNVSELAERAAGLFEAEAAEKGIRLSVEIEPGLPDLLADSQRVGQALGNLVSNALRYVPEGGQVCLSAHRVPAGVEVAVSDNGPGVADADLPHLFDRFWRGEKSRARTAGGAGLGLAIARQLIEAQGGTITASLQPEGGLRVAFTLPADSAPSA